jgi:hypothetical protein
MMNLGSSIILKEGVFMSFAKRVAVAINLNEPMKDILSGLRELEFLNKSEVHFVNVYLTTTYAVGLGEGSIVYPILSDQKKIQESTVAALQNMVPGLLSPKFEGKIVPDCLFADDPKRKFCHYVEEKNIDTVIVAAREKRGFFESSFTQYVSKHTRANMIVLKHKV